MTETYRTPLATTTLLGAARSSTDPRDGAWLRSCIGAEDQAFDRLEDPEPGLLAAWRRAGTGPEGAALARSKSGAIHVIVTGRLEEPTPGAEGYAEALEAGPSQALRELTGPCAGVFWFAGDRRSTLFRPVCGRRPLYYAPLANGVAFASDASSLASHAEIGFAPDWSGVAEYLAFGLLWGERTLARGVHCLGPGARVEASPAGLRTISSSLELESLPGDESECVERIDAALHDAVDRAWRGASRPALCLSAGLDSRTLMAVAHHRGIPLTCVTNGIDGSVELRLARRMCSVLDAEHLRCLIEPEIVERILDGASTVAACTDGEGALQNVIMLYVGQKYRDALGLDRVIRGNGGELLKLSLAYAFALPPELGQSGDVSAARHRLLGQLTRDCERSTLGALVRGELAEAIAVVPEASFDAAWDSLGSEAEHPAQRAALLFLRAFSARATVNAMRCMRQSVDLAQPFLDEAFVRTLLSAPAALRSDERLQLELIRRNTPALLRVPDSAVRAPLDASPLRRSAAALRQRVARRLGFGRADVPEKWLIENLNEFFRRILLEERSLSRSHIDPDGVRNLLSGDPARLALARMLLSRLTTLELHLRNMETR
jgi:asparagine synthetase B (glutamine-hydrolysing)